MPTITPFRLLDLPAELRNEIYRLVFEGTTLVIKPTDDAYRSAQAMNARDTHTPHLRALLGTNKQLRYESIPIFYGTTKFVATNTLTAYKYITQLDSKERSSIRHFTFREYVKFCASDDATDPEFNKHMHGITMQVFAIRGIHLDTAYFGYEVFAAHCHYRIWPEREGGARCEHHK